VTPVPNGTVQGKFVFETATGGAIYTVNGDGSNLALVSHGIDPAWSPDGKQITFARWDNTAPGLYIANADGSHEQIIYTSPRIRSPRWSPDGKYIAFTQDKTKNDNNPVWKLGVVEVATGKLLEPQCSKLCYVPSWGSDSVSLAYFDPSVGIMATNIFSGPPWLVFGPQGSYFDTAANIFRPILNMEPIQSEEISPDGKRIVYSQQAHDRWEVNIVNFDGSNPTGVTSPDLILSLFFNVVDHNVSPTWSPDGKQILFLSTRNGKWEFFVVNPDGTGLTQVLKNVTDSIPLQYGYSYERMIDWTQ
jgi:TolB protein